ncbi:MAG: hypothetical protein ACK55Z_29310, partial [bacterium]
MGFNGIGFLEIGKRSNISVSYTHLMLLMADSKGQKVDVRMVEGAWNFDAINEQYEKLDVVLDEFHAVAQLNSPKALSDWTAAEKAASSIALQVDHVVPSA